MVSKSQKSVEYRVKINFIEKRLYFLNFPALPIEEGCAKCKFHSYTYERKFEKWFTKSDFLALPYERLFFHNGSKNQFLVLYPLRR